MSDEYELSGNLNTKMKDDFKYNYYEIYCEPTEIDWSDPDLDLADYDFSNDNFSLMLRVKKGQEKPTEQEVEDFLGDDYLLIDTEDGKKRYHVIGVWESERDGGGEVFDLGDFEYEDIITYPEVLTSSLEEKHHILIDKPNGKDVFEILTNANYNVRKDTSKPVLRYIINYNNKDYEVTNYGWDGDNFFVDLDKSLIEEDLDLQPIDAENDLEILAAALAKMVAINCPSKVSGNVIYQLAQDFEAVNDDGEGVPIPYGIFEIFELEPGKITSWDAKFSTCQDVDLIGEKPSSYFTTSNSRNSWNTVEDFLDTLFNWFGWEDKVEEIPAFVRKYGDMLGPVEDIQEDLELQPVDVFDDEKAEALTLYLDDDDIDAAIVREYPEESSGYRSNLYENLEDNSEWLICTRDEAETYVRDRIYDYISDVGPLEAYSWDFVENYLDDGYFTDQMEEEIRYQVNDLSYDELAERLEDADIISEDDKIQDPDWEADEDEPDEEPEMIYSEDFLDSKRDELVDYEINYYSSGVNYFRDMFGDYYLKEQVEMNPESAVDINRMVDDLVDDAYFGDELAEDGEEIELAIRDENNQVKEWFYAYKIS